MTFLEQPGFADDVRSVLTDLLGLPPSFMDYTVQYNALNGLPIPISQVTGFQNQVGIIRLQSQTLTASAANITFSAIPQGYANLMIWAELRCDAAGTDVDLQAVLNGDTGANYDHIYKGQNTSATPDQSSSEFGKTSMFCGRVNASGANANKFGTSSFEFISYSNTTRDKTSLFQSVAVPTTSAASFFVGGNLWRSTAAITSIALQPNGGNFVSGSTATLYASGVA